MRVSGVTGDKQIAFLAGSGFVAITTLQFVAARFGLREHLTVIDIVSLRFAGAALIFLAVIHKTGTQKLKALGWRRAGLLAMLTGLPYPLIINWGLVYAPAAHAAALSPASIVFFSFVFSNLVFRDKISAARIVGIAAVVVGLALFVGASKVNEGGTLFGDLLFAGSGIMFAAYAVLVRKWSLDTMTATIAVVLLSCLPIPLLYALGPTGLHAASVAEIALQLVIQGFLAGAAAIVLYTYMVRQLGPLTASLFMPCIPITTAIVGVIVLDERLTLFQFVAIGIIALGMVLPILQRGIRKRQAPAPN